VTDDQPVLSILIKSGTYNDFMTLSLIASGAIAADYEVRIFAMDDAVYALRKENVGTDTVVHSKFEGFVSNMSESIKNGKVNAWWTLLEELKEIGELKITACALISEVTNTHKDDFHELVDEIAGVANFAFDLSESDHVVSI